MIKAKAKEKEAEKPGLERSSFGRRDVSFTAPDRGSNKREEKTMVNKKAQMSEKDTVRARATVYVVITCMVSASGGFLFGEQQPEAPIHLPSHDAPQLRLKWCCSIPNPMM